MRLAIAACALAATTACGGPSASDPGNGNIAASVPSPSSDTAISYWVEGPGDGPKTRIWRIARDGSASFDEASGDAQGRTHHLTAQIHVGPAGFAEIERLVSGLPAGEPSCDEYMESMVAMGWITVTRERPGQSIETRFDRNCRYLGARGVAYENVFAAAERMRQWASRAPGRKDLIDGQ